MNIKKIKLVDGGLIGADVVYVRSEEVEGRQNTNEVTEKPRRPIHLGLEIPFKDLRYYLLQICDILDENMSKDDKDSLIDSTNIVAIECKNDYFIIKGEKFVLGGKKIKLQTPKITIEDDYYNFETVVNIIKKIISETILFLSGSVKVSDNEFVERWIGAGKEKGIDINSFNEMSDDEKKEFCEQILEKQFKAKLIMYDDDIEEINESEIEDTIVLDDLKIGESIILKA